MTAQAPAPVQGALQTAPERVALQPNPRPLPQVNPLAAPVGLPRPVDNTPASVKPTETKAAKPVNNPLLLTPFPTSSMPTTNIVAPTNNVPMNNAPANNMPTNNSSMSSSPLTNSALPQLPALPESKKSQVQPEIKTPESTLQPVADRDLGRF